MISPVRGMGKLEIDQPIGWRSVPVYTYSHIYIHAYIYTYTRYIHTYIHICFYEYLNIQEPAYSRIYIYTHIHTPTHLHIYIYIRIYIYIYIYTYPYAYIYIFARTYTANLTWGDTPECSYKARNSKLERLFSLKRGKRDVRALSLEPSKITPQVGLAVPKHIHIWINTHIYIFTCKCTHTHI